MVVTTVAVVARTIGASGMFKVYGRRCTMIIMIVTFFVLFRKKKYTVRLKKKTGLAIQGFKDPLQHNCISQYF